MKKYVAVLMLLSFNCWAAEGYVVREAEVTKVTSSSSNSDIFRVYYSGGINDQCNGGVRFFQSKAGSEGIFNKTFSLATTALVSGMKVSIYSYSDNADCDSAITIELSK